MYYSIGEGDFAMRGEPFNVSWDLLTSLGHPPTQFTSLTEYSTQQLTAPGMIMVTWPIYGYTTAKHFSGCIRDASYFIQSTLVKGEILSYFSFF